MPKRSGAPASLNPGSRLIGILCTWRFDNQKSTLENRRMPEQSLLTDEIRALQGPATVMLPVEVTPRAVQRAMDVYLGHHEDAPDEPGSPVPGYVLAALDSESEPPALPTLLPNSLLISNEWSFERPLRLGEKLDVAYRITGISERFGGRFGYSIDFRTEDEFTDSSGAVVARSARNMMQYDASEARDEGAEG